MAKYDLLFKDTNALKAIPFYNARSFQWTDTRNKDGPANFTLDNTPTSRQIRAGWQVEIIRDGTPVYWGKVMKRTVKSTQIKIFCSDANGLLNKRTLIQRATTLQEASLEIKEKLNGLILDTGIVLSADSFVQPTGESQKWHWEGNSLLAYVVDIGENVKNLAGKSVPYFVWIDPHQNVQWLPDGKASFYKDLPLKNITLQEDIENTYNAITVEGNPVNVIPYDKDFWTENATIESWFGGLTTPTTFTYNTVDADKKWGNVSVKGTGGGSTFTIFGRRLTQNLNSTYNFENINSVSFWIKVDDTLHSDLGLTLQLKDSNNDIAYWIWADDPNFDSMPVSGVWKQITMSLNRPPDSGTVGEGSGPCTIQEISHFELRVTFASGFAHVVFLDNFYITLDVYNYTATDAESIKKFGTLEKVWLERSYYSNAETQNMAEILLNFHKDAKSTFNASLDGYARLIPNSTIEFKFEGEKFAKALTSATHYVTVEGAESCQLTLGDFKKQPIDELVEKLAEINRNYNLLENPYQIA